MWFMGTFQDYVLHAKDESTAKFGPSCMDSTGVSSSNTRPRVRN